MFTVVELNQELILLKKSINQLEIARLSSKQNRSKKLRRLLLQVLILFSLRDPFSSSRIASKAEWMEVDMDNQRRISQR